MIPYTKQAERMRRPGPSAITPDEARARGLVIDDTCYPWVAYRGPRFKPDELCECYTELEAGLLEIAERSQ